MESCYGVIEEGASEMDHGRENSEQERERVDDGRSGESMEEAQMVRSPLRQTGMRSV